MVNMEKIDMEYTEKVLDSFVTRLRSEFLKDKMRIIQLEEELAETQRELQQTQGELACKNEAFTKLQTSTKNIIKLYKTNVQQKSPKPVATETPKPSSSNKENMLPTPLSTVSHPKRTALAPLSQNTPSKRTKILAKPSDQVTIKKELIESNLMSSKTAIYPVCIKKELSPSKECIKTEHIGRKFSNADRSSSINSSNIHNHKHKIEASNTNAVDSDATTVDYDTENDDESVCEGDKDGEKKAIRDNEKRQEKDEVSEDQLFLWSDRFEINTQANNGYKYAYHEVVRNKQERKRMEGGSCECCAGYYERIHGDQSIPENREAAKKHQKKVSRHRYWWSPPRTPPGYWQTGFPTTQRVEELNAEARRRELQRLQYMEREAQRPDGKYRYRKDIKI